MRSLLQWVGQTLLVAGLGVIALAGSSSLLYAGVTPAPAVFFTPCPACTPCGASGNGCLQQQQCNTGTCTVNDQACGCTKGTGTVCACMI